MNEEDKMQSDDNADKEVKGAVNNRNARASAKAEAKASKAKAKALRPWYKKKRYIIIIIVIIVIGIFAGASENDTNATTKGVTDSTSSSEDNSDKMVSIGDAVKSGDFTFTVHGIKCGKKIVGHSQYLQQKAQGEFCLLDLTVKNVGKESKMLNSSNQYLYDDQGRKFSADSVATGYANPDSTTFFLNQINPGNGVTGKIVFDVPEKTSIVSAELGAGIFSDGVDVNLQ